MTKIYSDDETNRESLDDSSITTDNGSIPSTATTGENEATLFKAAATDADGDTTTYSLSGADSALFSIDHTTGVVAFDNAPGFKNPADSDGNNAYNLAVMASDGAKTTTDNENDIIFPNRNFNESSIGHRHFSSQAFGPFETNKQHSLAPSNLTPIDLTGFLDEENSAFGFGGLGANLIFPDSNNSSNDAPVFSSAATATVSENQTTVYTAAATDPEGGALTYSLSGADATLFASLDGGNSIDFISGGHVLASVLFKEGIAVNII